MTWIYWLGGATKTPRVSIGPNWSRQPLGGVKKAEVKYPGYTSPLPLLTRS